MSNELVAGGGGGLASLGLTGTEITTNKYATGQNLQAVAKSGDYLNRMILGQGSSGPCKKGKLPIGNYGIVVNKETVLDCTKECDVVLAAWRPRAIKIADNVTSFYNPESPGFKQVVALAGTSDSGCLYGAEFLLWVPQHQQFVTLHLNSPTMRKITDELIACLMKDIPVTLKTHYIETKKHSWYGPVVQPCSTPITQLPDKEKAVEIINKFNNPKEAEVEVDTDGGGRER